MFCRISKQGQGLKCANHLDSKVQGHSAFSTSGFEYETKSGLKVSIHAGKVIDNSIQAMQLVGDRNERELPVHKDSNLFFTIHQMPYLSLEVTAKK